MKVILFQDLIRTNRSSEDIIKIIEQTGADMLLRSASRVFKTSLHGDNYTSLINHISKIKSNYPNIKIIGNLYFQLMDRNNGEMDDITLQTWTEQQTYDLLSFDPSLFGITSISKCDYQCRTGCTCGPNSPGEAQTLIRYVPDITDSQNSQQLCQNFFIHQAQKLIEAGCDGIWIDGMLFNAKEVKNRGGSTANIQKCIDAALYVGDQIKKLKTLDNQTPSLSTWWPSGFISYLKNSPYWNDKYFDYLTITAPAASEIYDLIPKQNYDNIINDVKTNYSGVPIIAYIDWSFGKHPLWYFSQWYPGYTTCCDAVDSITNPNLIVRQKRHDFQISVLKTFTDYFNSLNPKIYWAYPVYGGGMCGLVSCDLEAKGPCCVTGSLEPNYPSFYDSQAPEFNTYSEIVKLINPMSETTTSQAGIGPVLVAGLLVGGIYLYLKNQKEHKSKSYS